MKRTLGPPPAARKPPCGRPPNDSKNEGNRSALQKEFLARLEAHVRERGLKQSAVRTQILEAILNISGHFSVHELTEAVREHSPQIGAATVYRNIPLLIEAGVLQETLKTDSGQAYYEVAQDDHHDHIVCLDCGRIFEFHDRTIEREQEKITQSMQFATQAHRHVIYANCQFGKSGDKKPSEKKTK